MLLAAVTMPFRWLQLIQRWKMQATNQSPDTVGPLVGTILYLRFLQQNI